MEGLRLKYNEMEESSKSEIRELRWRRWNFGMANKSRLVCHTEKECPSVNTTMMGLGILSFYSRPVLRN